MTKELILSLIPGASEEQADKFIKYYELLIEWNGKMTAITEEREVAEKHFADSLLPMELIPQNARCIDVGTGAGFPGIPLMIMRPDITVTLLDSLNKRLIFLNEVIRALGLEGRAKTLHMRSEDAGRAAAHRDAYDVALSRAVANARVLAEWTAPFVKRGGVSIMYKGAAAKEELDAAQNAMNKLCLGARLIEYPCAWGERYVIAAKKLAPTPKAYPRKAGTAGKMPL
mgnify:FL=1